MHHKLLLEHKALKDKYKLLRARLDLMGINLPSDIVFFTNFLPLPT